MARYNNQRKKSLMFCFVCIMLFIFGVTAGISYAYFTDHKEVSNTLNFGKLVVSANGNAGTSTASKVFVFGNASSENNGLLGVGDTIDFKGTVGLEENSINAYVRIKLDNFMYYTNSSKTTEATTKPSNRDKKTFIGNFLTAVADSTKASSGTQQDWTYIDNYLYYGKMMQEGSSNIYTFNSNIEITEELVPTSFWGLTIQFDIVIQAIQASGAVNSSNVKISDSVTATTIPTVDTARTVASATMWASAFRVESLVSKTFNDIIVVDTTNRYVKLLRCADKNASTVFIPSYIKQKVENGSTVWYASADNYEGEEGQADVYRVTELGFNTFGQAKNLTEITIPSMITKIGDDCFNGCSALKSVIFEVTTGWKANNTTLRSSDLANPTTAATFLTSTYINDIWTRS